MNNVEAIMFDLDGTLWDVIMETYKSVNIIAQKYHLNEVTLETIKKCMGMNNLECATNYLPELDSEDALNIFKEMVDLNNQRLKEYGGIIYDGVKETLIELIKRGYKLGIVSNCGDGYIEAFLDYSNLKDYFSFYLPCSKYNLSKDDAIKKIMNDNNIKSSVYVGDTQKDELAAFNAQIPFIYASYGFGKVDNYDYKLEKFADLLKIFKERSN